MQKRVLEIVNRISKERGIPKHVVEEIVKSQFSCARIHLKSGESGKPETFKNIRFRHLGILVAKPNRVNKLHKLKELKEQTNK